MKVLVIEPGQGTESTEQEASLAAAGHDVVRCADTTSDNRCKGMPGGSGCPVDVDNVDVAVVVGAAGDSPPEADGVRCVVRHFVPVVTTGGTDATMDGYPGQAGDAEWIAGAVPVVHADDADDALTAAVTVAAKSALHRHGELATAELHAVLAHHGINAPDASVVVHRASNGLRVEMFPTVPISRQVTQAAAVRVAAAIRAYDSASRGIGVVMAMGH
jgi:hypothetical protein